MSLPVFNAIRFMKLIDIGSSRLRGRVVKFVGPSFLPANWGNGFLTSELNQNGRSPNG
jgi:hypothetical protein